MYVCKHLKIFPQMYRDDEAHVQLLKWVTDPWLEHTSGKIYCWLGAEMRFYTKHTQPVRQCVWPRVSTIKGIYPGRQVPRCPAWCFRDAVSFCSLAEVRQVLQVKTWAGRRNGRSHSTPHSHQSCLISSCTLPLMSTAHEFPSSLWFRFGLQRGKGEIAFVSILFPKWSQRKYKNWSVLDTASNPGCLFLKLCLHWVEIPGKHCGDLHLLKACTCACMHTHTLWVPFLQPGVSLQTPQWDEHGAGRESRAITLVSSLRNRNSKFCQNLLL